MNPRSVEGTLNVTRRLPHGGYLDARLGSDGRVQLLLDADADVSQVLCELDTLRTALTKFHLAIVRQARTTTSKQTRKEAA